MSSADHGSTWWLKPLPEPMGTASVFLPFLAMLPAQIPLNNMLYDLSEVAIPLEHVLAALVVAYLGIVEAAKRMFYRHLATKPK